MREPLGFKEYIDSVAVPVVITRFPLEQLLYLDYKVDAVKSHDPTRFFMGSMPDTVRKRIRSYRNMSDFCRGDGNFRILMFCENPAHPYLIAIP